MFYISLFLNDFYYFENINEEEEEEVKLHDQKNDEVSFVKISTINFKKCLLIELMYYGGVYLNI